MSIAAMKQALEALENYTNVVSSVNDPTTWTPKIKDEGSPAREAITALRAAITEAERQEPEEDTRFMGGDYISGGYKQLGDFRPMQFTHPQPAIPDGWQLVPVEPTDKMKRAALETGSFSVRVQYKAMLAAAPKEMK